MRSLQTVIAEAAEKVRVLEASAPVVVLLACRCGRRAKLQHYRFSDTWAVECVCHRRGISGRSAEEAERNWETRPLAFRSDVMDPIPEEVRA